MLQIQYPLSKQSNVAEILENIVKGNNWSYEGKGEIKKFPGSKHYHLYSKDKGTKGVLELTFFKNIKKDHVVLIKLADNRSTDWSKKACEKLMNYFNG